MHDNQGHIYVDNTDPSNPIGVSVLDDIAYVLGRRSRDVGHLCGDTDDPMDGGTVDRGGKINKWAKYKPVRYLKFGELTEAERRAAAYGLSWDGGNGDSSFTFLPPRGTNGGGTGVHEPFRILDFDGYHHNSTSGLKFARDYTYDQLSDYGSPLTIRTYYLPTQICLNDLKDTLFSGYRASLLVINVTASGRTFYWESDWQEISGSGSTAFTIPADVLINTFPTGNATLILRLNNGQDSYLRQPFVSNGLLSITANTNLEARGFNYDMTIYGGTAAGAVEPYRTGVHSNGYDANDINQYLGFAGITVVNSSSKTITNSDIYMYMTWQDGDHTYYLRAPATKNGSWSISPHSSKSLSAAIPPEYTPRFGTSSQTYRYTAVTIYLEERIANGSPSGYAYARISDMITINIKRTVGAEGIIIR